MAAEPENELRHDGPTTTEERREQILAVAARLFAARGYGNVSVRDIAQEAGVTHPLIYYHWGSKRELLAAVLEETQEEIRGAFARAEAAHPDDPEGSLHEAIAEVFRTSLAAGRPYYATVVRALMDGMPAGEWPGGNPGAEALTRLLLASGPSGDLRWDVEARITAALVTSIITGWILLEDPLLSIVDLPEDERERARERLLATVDSVLRTALESRPDA